jgi:hypothetical protein
MLPRDAGELSAKPTEGANWTMPSSPPPALWATSPASRGRISYCQPRAFTRL